MDEFLKKPLSQSLEFVHLSTFSSHSLARSPFSFIPPSFACQSIIFFQQLHLPILSTFTSGNPSSILFKKCSSPFLKSSLLLPLPLVFLRRLWPQPGGVAATASFVSHH